eukprot:CAMPEP_0170603096 /NCGR_PEP_ID=MMETSP0224-20130122/18735_1 /TAXON_ID=285029 /ORGANISM="Togula jolla, Strain CCCM 725" /LENGTH=816 /DNA_ID=CAMNT_0010927965 /DNA_START=45 /DNA_END=2491 /DNA_ORIENTATION=+
MGCKASTPFKANADDGAEEDNEDQEKEEHDNLEFNETLLCLGKLPFFRSTPAHERPMIAVALEHTSFAAGQVVFREGDEGDDFYIITKGEAEVSIKGDRGEPHIIAALHYGEYFGENALLGRRASRVRATTITARTDLETLMARRSCFNPLKLDEKIRFGKHTVGRQQTRKGTKESLQKNEEEHSLLQQALLRNEDLNVFCPLNDYLCEQMIGVAWKETLKAGVKICREGFQGGYFYVVQEGSLTVSDKGHELGCLEKGSSFGEVALLYHAPHEHTITASTDVTLWIIDRTSFKNIVMKLTNEKINKRAKQLEAMTVFLDLKPEERFELSKALQTLRFVEGDVMIKEGSPASWFYILQEGEVCVTEAGRKRTVAAHPSQSMGKMPSWIQSFARSVSTPECVQLAWGQEALISDAPMCYTVTVTSKSAVVLGLQRSTLEWLLGPLDDLERNRKNAVGAFHLDTNMKISEKIREEREQMKKGFKTVGSSASWLSVESALAQSTRLRIPTEKIDRHDLVKVGLLGGGGWGAVELVEHRVTGETYALKTVSKGLIAEHSMEPSIFNERNAYLMTDSPFIIKLHACYNSPQNVSFLLEAALGGDLSHLFHNKHIRGCEKHVRFYAGCVVFAIEHLHAQRIVYRDLKPENLLLDLRGYIKLTDMGLAKFVVGKTFTTCGTPYYFAPEMASSAGHSVALDWWQFGVLLYELIGGRPPFKPKLDKKHPEVMDIVKLVMKGIDHVSFDGAKFGHDSKDLIIKLCRERPCERLPMLPNGAAALRKHRFLQPLDWNKLAERVLDPPYIPTVTSVKDTANFKAKEIFR